MIIKHLEECPSYIYVASSWRNEMQVKMVTLLRSFNLDVYDFKNPPHGKGGFHWSDIDENWQNWNAREYIEALGTDIAHEGFISDMEAMEKADTFVLLLPCGRSAHLELGWAVGQGKNTAVFLNGDHEPELMVKMCDLITDDARDLLQWMKVLA